MATMTVRMPDAKHDRLKQLARSQGVSLDKLVEDWASVALAQFDAETRFRVRAARGSAARGLAILDRLDQLDAADVKPKRPASTRRKSPRRKG